MKYSNYKNDIRILQEREKSLINVLQLALKNGKEKLHKKVSKITKSSQKEQQ